MDDAGERFNSLTIVRRAQKKVLSSVISRNNVKLFINDASMRLFDNLYHILKANYNKIVAEKVIKNIIKLIVKLSVISRCEQQLGVEQLQMFEHIQRQMRHVCLTVISFGKVAYSYDRAYLRALLSELCRRITPTVVQNLSEKSNHRLQMIFENVNQEKVLDSLFRVDGEHNALLPAVIADLEMLIESKDL